MTTIPSFYNRLKRIGIEVGLVGNFPWVYLDKVNGRKVHGTYCADHGFTVFFRAIKPNQVDKITDISTIFKKIRETLNEKQNPS
jgi:hypothetical protein